MFAPRPPSEYNLQHAVTTSCPRVSAICVQRDHLTDVFLSAARRFYAQRNRELTLLLSSIGRRVAQL